MQNMKLALMYSQRNWWKDLGWNLVKSPEESEKEPGRDAGKEVGGNWELPALIQFLPRSI